MSLGFKQLRFGEGFQRTDLVTVSAGDIHVYGISLDIAGTEVSRASRILSDEERARADCLVSESHRHQFIVAHAGLRLILSRYCGEPSHGLAIQKSVQGKPFVPDYPLVRFNLTHAHGRAIIAVANDREIGVDLEKIRPEVDVIALAKRFLSDRDVTFIKSSGPGQHHQRFLQAWVAREAVFKATGTGMTFPFHGAHFELASRGAEGRLILGDGKTEGAIRFVRFLPLDLGWVGAVAADGRDWSIVLCNTT